MAKKDWMVIESELDEDQIKVLMATNDKSCIVSGCAGSGKSVLALIKAQRIQKEKGNNYSVIVFTKALCRYMNAGKKALELANDFCFYWEWKNKKGCPSADYIIVDEIQDFTKDEILEFVHAAKKNFFFFGDIAQSIYQGLKDTMPVDEIRNLFPSGSKPKEFELYRNYRLPKPIALLVQYIGLDLDGFDINTYKSLETEIPRFINYKNLNDQITAIVEIITRQQLSDVAILLPHNDDVMIASRLLNKLGLDHELKYKYNYDTLDFTTPNPKIMTYHSAKGLQFDTVFIPNISESSTNPDHNVSDQKSLYVAMTRTCRLLYIMYSGPLPQPLSNVPEELYKTTETDKIEDI